MGMADFGISQNKVLKRRSKKKEKVNSLKG